MGSKMLLKVSFFYCHLSHDDPCDAPKSADRFPRSADGSFKASEGFPTPVTSPLRPPTPPAAQIRQNSGRKYVNKEVCMYIRTLKPLKTRKEKEELKLKRPGSTNCRNHSDVIVSGVIVTESNGDVTMQDVNKPIARKRYATKKQWLAHSRGSIKSLLRVCSQTFTKAACILAIVISILGGLFNIRLPERKSTIGTSSSLSPLEPLVAIRFLDSSVLSSLRESAAAIIRIREGLCSCMHKRMSLNNNKQLIRCMKILQDTTICEETIPDYATYASLASPSVAMVMRGSFANVRQNVFCEKTFGYIYIPVRGLLAFPSILVRYIYRKS